MHLIRIRLLPRPNKRTVGHSFQKLYLTSHGLPTKLHEGQKTPTEWKSESVSDQPTDGQGVYPDPTAAHSSFELCRVQKDVSCLGDAQSSRDLLPILMRT